MTVDFPDDVSIVSSKIVGIFNKRFKGFQGFLKKP